LSAVRDAIREGRVGGRLWLYANYHCNLRCTYCLTESAPGVERRLLAPEAMVERTVEARELGFTAVGVTGGEPFLLDWVPELIAELAGILPVVVLSNATLFSGRRPRGARAPRRPAGADPDLARPARSRAQRRDARAGELRQGGGGDPRTGRTRNRRANRHHD
jgi:hypothetical protein